MLGLLESLAGPDQEIQGAQPFGLPKHYQIVPKGGPGHPKRAQTAPRVNQQPASHPANKQTSQYPASQRFSNPAIRQPASQQPAGGPAAGAKP
jgi:hypothetical protein